MLTRNVVLIVILTFIATICNAQINAWNGKQCAVVLTYDDAIDADLDNVIPALDSMNFKATFYVMAQSVSLNTRLDEWRMVAKNGHELGNHTLFHPCDCTLPNREFVTADHTLNTDTPTRAGDEIRMQNLLLKAIDGKTRRTFAYPCGDETINGVRFFNNVKGDFVAARGTLASLQTANQVKLDDIHAYPIEGEGADYMINLVNQAMKTHTLLVFLFHGVGGGHPLNCDLEAHSKLLHYLKANQKNIWIAPMIDVADMITDYQKQKTSQTRVLAK